jgi:RNA polymerase sigma-70 factor, ECF subfamily
VAAMSKSGAQRPKTDVPSPSTEPASTADDHMTREPCDRDEFENIVKEHREYLVAAARRLTGNADAANDLVQRALLQGWLHFARFERGSNARAWLVTIMTRLFIDDRKHDKVVAKFLAQHVTQEVVDSNLDVTLVVHRDAAVRTAIEGLEPELREILRLRYFEGMAYKEISDKLQLAMGTVSTRLNRAHARLKELLLARDAADEKIP